MSDDLRAPLPRAFERLADDLVIGRHGDPHVAFAVLVFPDREPIVVSITGSGPGAHDLSRLLVNDENEDRKATGRFFSSSDISEAACALMDASGALRDFAWRRDKDLSLGAHVVGEIRRLWHLRRDAQVERELEAAAHNARYAFKCEICGSGYTERGLKMHQSRSRWCSRELAKKAASDG